MCDPLPMFYLLRMGEMYYLGNNSNNNNFKIFFSLQFRRDFSMLRKQMLTKLISIRSYFPEVCPFGTLNMSPGVLGLYSAIFFG